MQEPYGKTAHASISTPSSFWATRRAEYAIHQSERISHNNKLPFETTTSY